MTRPTKEQVDAALAIAAGAKRPGPTTTLADEVNALRARVIELEEMLNRADEELEEYR